MKHCQQCNQNFADDFNYCLSCGNPIKETVATDHSRPTTGARETFIQCLACKNFVRSDAWRCEYCGTVLGSVEPPVSSRAEPPPTQYVQPQQWQASSASSQTAAEHSGFSSGVPPPRVAPPTAPIRNEPTTPSVTGFQPYGAATAARRSSFRWWHALILVGFFFGLLAVLGVGGWWWWSSSTWATNVNDNTNQSETSATNANDNTNQSEATSSTPSTSRQSEPTVSENSADSELRRLQATINDASSSGSQILPAIAAAEEKYPTDYRFRYERAKLVGKGMINHKEGWHALSRAAEIAIDGGKAQEMSADMVSRERSDFARLSSHPAEWNEIIEALNNKDKTLLKNLNH